MSVPASKNRSIVLALGIIATAAIAACDNGPTQPSTPLSRIQLQPRAIEGDTLQCPYGWIIVGGRYVCSEE